ncbi:hypothetical protein [Hymenobacter sp. CRA2]|uniref:hypothetical protein n=1 Tax=Hymenobacter sp. CRA2 TaxID=1955620 RepID=UPI001115F8E9|nr:hypothetical protein [Hymenobacter sp. CRA2]
MKSFAYLIAAFALTSIVSGCEESEQLLPKGYDISAKTSNNSTNYLFNLVITNTPSELSSGFSAGSLLKWRVEFPCTGQPTSTTYFNVYLQQTDFGGNCNRYLIESNVAISSQCLFPHNTIIPANIPGGFASPFSPRYNYALIVENIPLRSSTDSRETDPSKGILINNSNNAPICEI